MVDESVLIDEAGVLKVITHSLERGLKGILLPVFHSKTDLISAD